MEATASVNVKNNSKLKALLAAGTAGAAMLGVGLMGTTAHADTLVDVNHVQVDAGDTLSDIAHKHNTTVDQLAKDNNISDINMIHVGDKLVISPNGGQNDNSGAANTSAQSTGTATVQNTAVNNRAQAGSQQSDSAVTTGTNGGSNYASSLESNAAANAIAQAESGGSYTAQNGRYYGKYQLDLAYLGGDLSPQHQDQVFQQYCNQRYGGISNALSFRNSHGWY